MKNVTSPPFLCVEFKTRGQILILRYSQTEQIFSLFHIVFETLQLFVSLEPIDQFQWGLL